MDKVILHADMNNYFAAVECIDKPELRGVPMAVCGDPAMRHGIVLARNDIAKAFGVTGGESSFAARGKCPAIVILKPDYPKYLEYAKKARRIYAEYTDKIYPYGLDEAWLDVSASCRGIEEGRMLADRIRSRIRTELALTASVGVSFNFIFAKLASDLKKPDATTVLPAESLEHTIWNLPAFDLLFVGAATRKTLRGMGILSIGDLARADPALLQRKLGKKGGMLRAFANGDDSSFNPCSDREEDLKSFGNTITPPRDLRNNEEVASILRVLAGSVAQRLKKHHFKTVCVGISVRDDHFTLISRQRTLSRPTDREEDLFEQAYDLFQKNHNWAHCVRSIGLRADKISDYPHEQLSLFDYFHIKI